MDNKMLRKLFHQYSRGDNKSKSKAKVKLMRHQKILEDVACNGLAPYESSYDNIFAPKYAIEMLTDESLLINILNGGFWENHRIAAIKNPYLKNEGALFHAASHGSIYERRHAISRLDDDELLLKIVNSNYHDDKERKYALGRIKDENILKDIFLKKTCKIYENAILNISDEKFLADVVYDRSVNLKTRIIAARRITNQKILGDITMNESFDVQLRKTAVERIEDETKLIYFSKCPSKSMRLAAVGNPNLTDEETLADCLKYDESVGVRFEALKKIDNQEVIIDFAYHILDTDISYRRENKDLAISKINSKNALRDIMKISGIGQSRLDEINKLSQYRQMQLLSEK